VAQNKLICAPFRFARRYDINMAGQDVSPTYTGANRRKQIEAGTFGTKEDRHFAASCQAVPAYLTDNRVIGCGPNSGECNQPREGFFDIHRRPLC
jgi:hypothetical protein